MAKTAGKKKSKKPATKKRTPRAIGAAAKAHARQVYAGLTRLYPDAHCALRHRNPFELLMATILSAQCTDVRVNMVTPALFKKYPRPGAMADAPLDDLEELIRTTGFFRNKAKSLKGACKAIVRDHRGQVPDTMPDLVKLPGVARKTANVVLGNAFDINEGVVVDTHVARLSQRLGLTRQKDPGKIEQDLIPRFDRRTWTMLAHRLIFHGRQVCRARKPLCDDCGLAEICPKRGVQKESRVKSRESRV